MNVHAASLSAASHANRSRRLIKCAKDSGHYPVLAFEFGLRTAGVWTYRQLGRKNARAATIEPDEQFRNWGHLQKGFWLSVSAAASPAYAGHAIAKIDGHSVRLNRKELIADILDPCSTVS
jgi:hypothetical protein